MLPEGDEGPAYIERGGSEKRNSFRLAASRGAEAVCHRPNCILTYFASDIGHWYMLTARLVLQRGNA